MLQLLTLGGLSVRTDEGPVAGAPAQPRRLAILALLARAADRGLTRDKLLAMLWPDADDEQGRRVLKQAIYALRRDLGDEEALLGTRELRLNPESIWCDVVAFADAVGQEQLEDGVALYAGPFLDGFRLPGAAEFERWAEEERGLLLRQAMDALERLARRADAAGDAAVAVRWWRRRAALDPLDANVACALMRSLTAAGDRAGALRHARLHEALIEQELGLPPDAEVQRLAGELRSQPDLPPTPRETIPALGIEPAIVPPPAPDSLAIAVLPFACMPADAQSGAFAGGVVEEIIDAALRAGIRVASRTVSATLSPDPHDLATLGARLGVHGFLEGSVRSMDGHVRVTVRLVSAATGFPLWCERIDAHTDDVFAAQDRVASAVALRLRSSAAPLVSA